MNSKRVVYKKKKKDIHTKKKTETEETNIAFHRESECHFRFPKYVYTLFRVKSKFLNVQDVSFNLLSLTR